MKVAWPPWAALCEEAQATREGHVWTALVEVASGSQHQPADIERTS